jgi:hypothetical protein
MPSEHAWVSRVRFPTGRSKYILTIVTQALESFDEWNSDPIIAARAKDLYSEIDNLELYVGSFTLIQD